MGHSAEDVKNKLIKELNATKVEVIDDSDGCGAKFRVLVVSDCFAGKTLLERHRLVNKTLEEEMKTIHAFSQKSVTPEEYEKTKPTL